MDTPTTARTVCGAPDGCHRNATAYRVIVNDEVRHLCGRHAAIDRHNREEAHRMPEWRRRSLEGRGRFDAVADMTDRVAGR